MLLITTASSKENRPSQGVFGASCSLSRGAGEAAEEYRHDSQYSRGARERPAYPSTEPKAAMCDDFDDDEDDIRTDRRGRRDREIEKSVDSALSVGSFRRVPTVQRLEDMELHGGDSSSSTCNSNRVSNSRGKDSSRFGSNSSYSDLNSRGASQSQSQPLFRSSAKLGSPEKPDGSLSGRAKGATPYQSSSAREENDWDRAPGISRAVFSSSSSSTGRAPTSTGHSAEHEHAHTRLPHTALGSSSYHLTTPVKSGSSGSSSSKGSGAGTQSNLGPSVGTATVSTKARYQHRAVPILSSHFEPEKISIHPVSVVTARQSSHSLPCLLTSLQMHPHCSLRLVQRTRSEVFGIQQVRMR
jgi:hypothetical protein